MKVNQNLPNKLVTSKNMTDEHYNIPHASEATVGIIETHLDIEVTIKPLKITLDRIT